MPEPKTYRRSHRKSRNGCIECKRRHIRCDGRRPACANCTIAERICQFPPAKPAARERPSKKPSTSAAPSTTSDARTPSDATRQPSPLPSFGESFPESHESPEPRLFTAEHLTLLYHITLADNVFMAPGKDGNLVEIAIRFSSSHPYLIDQVLAFSALHKALTSSTSSTCPQLLRTATELQTRAIARFTRLSSALPPEDTPSSISRFLFAAVLARHDLADTLSSIRTLRRSQFPVFVNRFVDCFRIHHGVRAVTRPIWQHLLNSELEPIFTVTLEARCGGPSSKTGDECRPLHRLLDSSDAATMMACRDAVERLQWAFDVFRNLPSCMAAGPHAATAFSVLVSNVYVDVLRRLLPEPVVVLAYYGVLLHHCRHYWVFGDAGAFVVRAIAEHLGEEWQDVMAWPLSMVDGHDETDKSVLELEEVL